MRVSGCGFWVSGFCVSGLRVLRIWRWGFGVLGLFLLGFWGFQGFRFSFGSFRVCVFWVSVFCFWFLGVEDFMPEGLGGASKSVTGAVGVSRLCQ